MVRLERQNSLSLDFGSHDTAKKSWIFHRSTVLHQTARARERRFRLGAQRFKAQILGNRGALEQFVIRDE